jgi:hypothetical protein
LGLKGKIEMAYADPEERRKYMREYRTKNADKIKAQRAAYQLKNADKIKAGRAEYLLKNAEKEKARTAEYQLKNAEKIKARKAAWYRENAEREGSPGGVLSAEPRKIPSLSARVLSAER